MRDKTMIGGGQNNIAAGQQNAILGGCGNCDNGHNFVGIFGCNVKAVMDNAFHANAYLVDSMLPTGGGPIVSGQLYYCIVGAGNCPVFIR